MDTAAELGEVKLAKGWTATMLEMPKRTVTQADGKKVSEAAASCAPPLAHRSAQLALFFTQCPPLAPAQVNYYTAHAAERLKKQAG